MLNQLFGTFIGLLSLFTLVFLVGMAIFLWHFVKSKMTEDEKNANKNNSNHND